MQYIHIHMLITISCDNPMIWAHTSNYIKSRMHRYMYVHICLLFTQSCDDPMIWAHGHTQDSSKTTSLAYEIGFILSNHETIR